MDSINITKDDLFGPGFYLLKSGYCYEKKHWRLTLCHGWISPVFGKDFIWIYLN